MAKIRITDVTPINSPNKVYHVTDGEYACLIPLDYEIVDDELIDHEAWLATIFDNAKELAKDGQQ